MTNSYVMAKTAVTNCCLIEREPGHYRVYRWAFARAFASGSWPDIAASDKRQLSSTQIALRRSLHWKALCRQAVAHQRLRRERLGGTDLMKEEDVKEAIEHRDKAKQCESKSRAVHAFE